MPANRPAATSRPGSCIRNEILSGALAFLDAVPGGTFNYEMLRACNYRDGLIVALFAARPIRLANMTEMTIGRQLLADNDRWLCRFTADEMKDDRPLAFSIPDTLCPYLEIYLNVYRPLLLKCNRHDPPVDFDPQCADARADHLLEYVPADG